MVQVIHLRTEQELPDADAWVRIRCLGESQFQVRVHEGQGNQMTFEYVSDRLDSFATALWGAEQYADAIEVATVFAIGCEVEQASR
jgi:hypothetical protein